MNAREFDQQLEAGAAKPRKQIEVFAGTGADGGRFYWRARDRNRKIVAIGGEPYSTRSNARRAARRIIRSLFLAPIIDV